MIYHYEIVVITYFPSMNCKVQFKRMAKNIDGMRIHSHERMSALRIRTQFAFLMI